MKKFKKSHVHLYDAEELAAHILGVYDEYEEHDSPSSFIDDKLCDEFGIPAVTFTDIVSRLLPLVGMDKSELTGKVRRGFVVGNFYVVKEDVEQ